MEIKVLHQVMEWNEDVSAEVRKTLSEKKVCLINVMGSPGTGKTSLITELIARLRGSFSIGVIEGDITGQIDAEKIAALQIPRRPAEHRRRLPHRGDEHPAHLAAIRPVRTGCPVCRKHRQPGVPGRIRHRRKLPHHHSQHPRRGRQGRKISADVHRHRLPSPKQMRYAPVF